MGLKDLHLKLKAFRLRRFLTSGLGKKARKPVIKVQNQQSWMKPVSHGYHVVGNCQFNESWDDFDHQDVVVVQREQIEEIELWVYGVFDPQVGDKITKYLQAHLFDKMPKESQIRKKSIEAMKKAYSTARLKMLESAEKVKHDDKSKDSKPSFGSASAIVINGEKLVIANMGGYRAVVCRNGAAHLISSKNKKLVNRHWSKRFIPGTKSSQSSEVIVESEGINLETEFVILASSGIWEVMKDQEAVSLVRHMEDAEEAAECLAKEAITRMSKSNICCLVIRFD